MAPTVYALGRFVLGSEILGTYAVFAAFVGLVFSDYGGPPLRRAGAYATMTVLGILSVCLGAWLSDAGLLGAAGMFVVMFCATFATVFGGYRPQHVAPIALAYSLSVLQPLDAASLGDRVGGWALGGVASLLAALLLWPTHRRGGLRQAAGSLAGELAKTVALLDRPEQASAQRALLATLVTQLQADMSTPLRPFGPAARDIAMVHLVEHLEHCAELIEEVMARPGSTKADPELLAQVSSALERTRQVLLGAVDPSEAARQLTPLDAARRVDVERIDADIETVDSQGAVLARRVLDSVPLLALSQVALWIEYDAVLAMGVSAASVPRLGTVPEISQPRPSGIASLVQRTGRIASWELDPEGVVLKNSIRAGIAMAGAIAAAELLSVQHGFWIALAAMSVLRSRAASTYATALEAVEGTIVGFVLAGLLSVVVGSDSLVLWVLFPLVAALAGYAPGAINFAVGQTAFTVLVVILFGLNDAAGFDTAVARLETVSIGAILASVLSLVLWPRGARAALARTVAATYRASAAAARGFVTGPIDQRQSALVELSATRRRAEAAFSAAVAEHSEPIDPAAWVRVFQPTTMTRALTFGLVAPVSDPPAGCASALDATEAAATAVADRLLDVAAWLERGGTGLAGDTGLEGDTGPAGDKRVRSPNGAHRPACAQVEEAELRRCAESAVGDHDAVRQAVVVAAWAGLIGRLDADIERAVPELRAVCAASTQRAWLREGSSPPRPEEA